MAESFVQPIYKDGSEWHWFLQEPIAIVESEILTKRVEEDEEEEEVPVKPVTTAAEDTATATGRRRRPKLPKIEHGVEP